MDIDLSNETVGNSVDVKNDAQREDEDVKPADRDTDTALLRCRACLLSGVKLFNIHKCKLADAFRRITGSNVQMDRLPQHLCWYCKAVLLRGDAFRAKCLRAQDHLMAELRGELATDYIRTLHRQTPTLTLGSMQIIDCTDMKPRGDIKYEPDPDIDIVDIDRIINKAVLKTEKTNDVVTNIKKDENLMNVKEMRDVKKKRIAVKKKIAKDDKHEIDSNSFESEKVEFEFRTEDDVTIISSDENDVFNVKAVRDVKKKKRTAVKKNIAKGVNYEIDSDSFDTEKNEFRIDDDVIIINKDENDVKDIRDIKKKKRTVVKENIAKDDNYEIDSDSFDTEKIEFEFGTDNELYASSIDIPSAVGKVVNNGKKRKGAKKIKKELQTDESKEIDMNTKPKEVKRRRKKKEEVMRKFRNADNDYMPVFDFTNFESKYSCKIVTLTKEEQLAEIASRKESTNYLESTFRCEDCGKGFLAEAAFNNHRQRHSPSAGPYACEICSVRFTMKCRRQEHQDMHRLKFFCRECSFVSRVRHQAQRHHAMHAGKTYECQHCGKSYNKVSTYLSHVRLVHPAMNVACDLCGETFVGQVGLRQHKTKMHAEIKKPQFNCTSCSASFVSLDALNRHTDTGEHSGSPCEQCGESCASEEELRAHVGERHPAESHKCEECAATFSSAASFDLHHRRKHLNQPFSAAGRPAGRVYRAAAGQYVCEQCGSVKPTPTLLRLHQRIHTDVKPFACTDCPKTFAAKHARDWHIRTHTGEKPFQCPLCPLAFSLNSNYKRHHKAVHLGQRARVPCAVCARVFTTRSCLRVHVDKVHRGLPWPKRDRKKKREKQ